MCADCHSTAVVKGYDRATRSYRTTFTEVSVGCEACHGPGSVHVESAGERPPVGFPDSRQGEINACAPCHSRRAQLAEGFQPHRPFLDHYSPALLDDGLYFADGQIRDEVYVYGSFLQSRMHAAGVTCSDCHEPHSAGLRAEGNALCVACHNPIGREDFPTLPLGEFDHPDHHLHEPGTAGSRCVDCHMPARTYMVVDDRRDHGFRIPPTRPRRHDRSAGRVHRLPQGPERDMGGRDSARRLRSRGQSLRTGLRGRSPGAGRRGVGLGRSC